MGIGSSDASCLEDSLNEMDSTDARQEQAIEQLRETAKDNQATDRRQWFAIVAVVIGLLVYFNAFLLTMSRDQANTISWLKERCR